MSTVSLCCHKPFRVTLILLNLVFFKNNFEFISYLVQLEIAIKKDIIKSCYSGFKKTMEQRVCRLCLLRLIKEKSGISGFATFLKIFPIVLLFKANIYIADSHSYNICNKLKRNYTYSTNTKHFISCEIMPIPLL